MGSEINLTDPEFLRDRRRSYRALRHNSPFAETRLNGEKTVVLTRFRDVDAVLRSKLSLVQPAVGEFPAYIGTGAASNFYRLSVPSIDDPDHIRLRRVVLPALTSQAIARMEHWIAQIIDLRIGEIENGPVIDVVAQLGDTIPVDVACRLLHIPRSDADLLVSRVNDVNSILSQSDMTTVELARADAGAELFYDYFGQLMKDNRELPDTELLGALSKAAADGRMTPEEAETALMDVFLGSYHTTMVSFANAICALAMYPDERARLLADPSLAARAWEEVLRFDAPVHFRHRYVREALILDGYRIEPRVKIMLGLAAANWDENEFGDPDVYRISRSSQRHMAFGGGGHFCLGSQLSRTEGRLFLPRFLARFPDFELAETAPARVSNLTFPYMERLPIALAPSPSRTAASPLQ